MKYVLFLLIEQFETLRFLLFEQLSLETIQFDMPKFKL